MAAAAAGVLVGTLACALVFRAMSGGFCWAMAFAVGGGGGLAIMVALGGDRPASEDTAD